MIRKMTLFATVGLALCALIAIPVALTSAQNQKDDKQAQGKAEQKKATLREAVTKKSPSEIEAKPGFELVLKGESGFTVRRAGTKEIVGSLGCSVCPGGKCRAKIISGGGACRGCGSSTGRDCTYDPF